MPNEVIDVDIDESNELVFKIKIEGTQPGVAKIRLVCENNDISYIFNGESTGEQDMVQFITPVMNKFLKEGAYHSHIEVIVDNRHFMPVDFDMNFKKTMKVQAQSMQRIDKKQKQPSVTVESVEVRKRAADQPKQTSSIDSIVKETKSALSALRRQYEEKKK
jgi:hypothetical protein